MGPLHGGLSRISGAGASAQLPGGTSAITSGVLMAGDTARGSQSDGLVGESFPGSWVPVAGKEPSDVPVPWSADVHTKWTVGQIRKFGWWDETVQKETWCCK